MSLSAAGVSSGTFLSFFELALDVKLMPTPNAVIFAAASNMKTIKTKISEMALIVKVGSDGSTGRSAFQFGHVTYGHASCPAA